jgi:ubiquinone/menaquinone biosynthesis C-methylase UbiE/uncharacterized protein YbaR (Trm112 family)
MEFSSLTFCCPQCKGELEESPDNYFCRACSRRFPIVLGIPDFRVFPDPYIDYKDDWEKAGKLAERFNELDFVGLVQFYWDITPSTPADLAKRYVRYALSGVERGHAILEEINSLDGENGSVRHTNCLEIGCGTGGLLVAAGKKFERLVGIDIAFRWLIVAKKRIQEAKMENISLLSSCAEYLPFPDRVFDLTIAADVLEHTQNQDQVIKESHRVLKPEGAFYYSTTNRFTLTPELHVRLWGVGFLPRKWMKHYVRMMKGIPYENIRSLSFFELKRLLKTVPFHKYKITVPAVRQLQRCTLSSWEKLQISAYKYFRMVPVFRLLLFLFGPHFSGMCRKGLQT